MSQKEVTVLYAL